MDSLGFFGAINPLSNFYECTFRINGENYISSEQFIQSEKARFFRDQQAFDRIMGCNNSLDCKIEASYVKNYNRTKWEEVAKEICRPGIKAKFEQNPDILETLVTKTGNKTLVECARDRFWGIGVPLADPDCLNTTKWLSNQGILGELLEEIRGEYHASSRMVTSLEMQKMPSHSETHRPMQAQIEHATPTSNLIRIDAVNTIDDMETDINCPSNIDIQNTTEYAEDSIPVGTPHPATPSNDVGNQVPPHTHLPQDNPTSAECQPASDTSVTATPSQHVSEQEANQRSA